MIKDIHYTGYTTQPSDYECPDGDLASALNLINENNTLVPLCKPSAGFSLSGSQKPLLLHKVGDGLNLLISESISEQSIILKYCSVNKSNPTQAISLIQTICNSSEVFQARAIGNVVVLSHKDKIEYLLWDSNGLCYKCLGSSLPDVQLSFALDSELIWETKDSGEIKWVKSSSVPDPSEDDVILNTTVFSAGSIHLDGGCSLCIDLPDFEIQQGIRYAIEFNCNLIASYFTIWYGNAAHEKGSHTQALLGACNKRKEFLAEKSGPIHFSLVSYAMDDSGHLAYNDYDIPSSISVSLIKVGTGNISQELYVPDNTPENINLFTGCLNKFIQEKATNSNRFIFPFFVRYALRLFDGTHAALSAPILLIPNSDSVPLILSSNGNAYSSDTLLCTAFVSQLCFRVDSVSNLDSWKEIVTGVDVFVSAPIWTYDQSVSASSLNQSPFKFIPTSNSLVDYFSIGRHQKGVAFLDNGIIEKMSFQEVFNAEGDDIANKYKPYWIKFSAKSQADIMEELKSAAQFYKIHSFDIDEIINAKSNEKNFSSIKLKKYALNNLVSRQVLVDDCVAVSDFAAPSLFEYNSRLNIFSFGRYLPRPFGITQCNAPLSGEKTQAYMRLHIQTTAGMRFIDSHIDNVEAAYECPWMYYPVPNAKRIEIVVPYNNGLSYRYWDIPLKNHDFLNGSFALSGSLSNPFAPEILQSNPLETCPDYPDSFIPATGLIYLSDVNNPFVFRTTFTVSIPCNKIFAISSAAKALSQGQFGQFPLYAFTDNGVWALAVSDKGAYSARQPITRDVILSKSSPLQLDSVVLFATQRGLMLLSGSQTKCISDVINAEQPFNILRLPGMDKLHTLLGHSADTCLPTVSFLQFLSDSAMLYDYVHQRVILFNPAFSYAYVYSLKSQQWGMMHSNLKKALNSYPDAIAVNTENALVSFSVNDSNIPKGLLVTRPLKLQAPDILKTVDTVIQRGHFRKGNVQSVLYGSRDLFNWHLIWSSKDHCLRGFRGTPYKYFRIACITNLAEDESIFGASLQFNPRHTNLLR